MDSCKPHFKTLEMLTDCSVFILEAAMFIRNNQHLFKAKIYRLYETIISLADTTHLAITVFEISDFNLCQLKKLN